MPNKPVLAVFLLATVGVAAGSAWAAANGAATNDAAQTDPAHAAVMTDFGKLSADGAKGLQELNLARLAIYDGKTDQAKKFADDAATSFDKAKGDDSAFLKAETELMTAAQVKAKKGAMEKSGVEKSGAKQADASADEPASRTADKATDDASAKKVVWLPVDGAMSLNEDYTMSPAKAKAVDEANKHLAKGDRKGALDQLKLADVSTSVVLEVLPRDQTVTDVHQAAQMIDSGKYYEGSQMLRKVQLAARYDVTDVVGTPKAATASKDAAAPEAGETAKTH